MWANIEIASFYCDLPASDSTVQHMTIWFTGIAVQPIHGIAKLSNGMRAKNVRNRCFYMFVALWGHRPSWHALIIARNGWIDRCVDLVFSYWTTLLLRKCIESNKLLVFPSVFVRTKVFQCSYYNSCIHRTNDEIAQAVASMALQRESRGAFSRLERWHRFACEWLLYGDRITMVFHFIPGPFENTEIEAGV